MTTIYQVHISFNSDNSSAISGTVTIPRLGYFGSTSSYDPTIKAFSTKTKAEDYMADLESAYAKLKTATRYQFPHLSFKLIEVEVE